MPDRAISRGTLTHTEDRKKTRAGGRDLHRSDSERPVHEHYYRHYYYAGVPRTLLLLLFLRGRGRKEAELWRSSFLGGPVSEQVRQPTFVGRWQRRSAISPRLQRGARRGGPCLRGACVPVLPDPVPRPSAPAPPRNRAIWHPPDPSRICAQGGLLSRTKAWLVSLHDVALRRQHIAPWPNQYRSGPIRTARLQ